MTQQKLTALSIQLQFKDLARYALGALLLSGLFFANKGLSAEDAPVLKKPGREVTIPVVIRDKHEKYITDLTKDDFTLTENGKPQVIHTFSLASNQPVTVGLIIDTSASQRDNVEAIRTASKHFLEQVLTNPKDRFFILHFDREVELLQDTTAHRERIQPALDALSAASAEQPVTQPGSEDDASKKYRGPSDVVYDGIYLAANDLMKKEQGRKILVLISDGGDRNSKVTAVSAIEAAQQSNAAIYSVYLKGEETSREASNNYPQNGSNRRRTSTWPGGGGNWPGGGGGTYPGGGDDRRPRAEAKRVDSRKTLDQISAKTGGRMYEATKKDNLDRAYSDLAEELRSQYLLTYTPDHSRDSAFHQVQLVPKKKDLVVQIADGYYPEQ